MIIQTQHLTKRFRSSKEAVSQLSLSVEEGSIYGFLGPNGAGKTTTIRLLLGLITPSEGEVLLFDQPLRRGNKQGLRNIGSLVETPSLYPHMTGRENLQLLAMLLQLPQKRSEEMLQLVELTRDADRKVQEYSLGMKQRLGIAAALVHQPRLLILDEPTNGLDPQGMKEMREFLKNLPEQFGITVFLSSHLLSEIEQIATHIGIINQGKMIFQGTLQALQDQTSNYVALTVSNPQSAQDLLRPYLAEKQEEDADDRTIFVRVSSEKQVAEIIRRLLQENIEVYSAVPKTLHLEELFFLYTSQSANQSLNESAKRS